MKKPSSSNIHATVTLHVSWASPLPVGEGPQEEISQLCSIPACQSAPERDSAPGERVDTLHGSFSPHYVTGHVYMLMIWD